MAQRLDADSPLREPTISVILDDVPCYLAYLLDLPMAAFIAVPFRHGVSHTLSGKKLTKVLLVEEATKGCIPISGVLNFAPDSTSKTFARSAGVPSLRNIGSSAALHCIALHRTALHYIALLAQRCLKFATLERMTISCDMPL